MQSLRVHIRNLLTKLEANTGRLVVHGSGTFADTGIIGSDTSAELD